MVDRDSSTIHVEGVSCATFQFKLFNTFFAFILEDWYRFINISKQVLPFLFGTTQYQNLVALYFQEREDSYVN